MDYRDKKPHLNVQLFKHLVSGCGLRQAGRMLPLSRRCVEMKARKLGRHLRGLNLNLRGPLANNARLQFDEFETYEGCRNTRPLTLPMLIEADSRFIFWSESATIRPKGKMTPQRTEAIARDEACRGRRTDQSRTAILRTLRSALPLTNGVDRLFIDTDQKLSYPGLLAEVFKGKTIFHRRTSSKIVRDTSNPLFAINHTEAMLRDLKGRLRRDSWLTSKKRKWLDVAMHLFIAYRNLIRPRFNKDKWPPATYLGFVDRCLSWHESLSWRQDWDGASIHPMSARLASVSETQPPLG